MPRIACRAARASLLVAVAFALSAPAVGQDKAPELYDLHLKTPKGTTVWFVESTTTEQTHKFGKLEFKANFQINRTFGITIKQIDAKGNRIVEIHVARIAGWAQVANATKTSYDSNDGHTEGQTGRLDASTSRMMAAVGRRYIARIDGNGKLVGSMAGIAHEMQGNHPQTSVQDWELADLAETAFGRTPAKPKAIGGTWKFVQSGTVDAIRLARHATMKLTRFSDDKLEMTLTGTVEISPIPIPPPAKGSGLGSAEAQVARMNKKVEISNGKLSGKQALSRLDGLVIATESKSTFDLDMATPGRNHTVEMIIKTNLTRTTKPDIKPRPPRKTLSERAKTAKTQMDTKLIAGAVRMFYVKSSKLPDTLEELTKLDNRGRRALTGLPKDGWDQAYKLVVGDTPREFQVVSAGPDKKHGTADDISSRTKRR
ncbi:MAG: hypothetical protein ACI89X_000361 [Planctomycetota bacterium]|jgi:hypothetical protein